MPPARGVLLEASLDLAWSHWVGLGVRGVAPAPDTAVDLEALLCFTSYLGEHDPRLLGEVADWWRKYRNYVSEPRLKTMARRFGEEHWSIVRDVLENTKKHSGKSELDRLDTRARSLLRLRSVFGANARAEILLDMLTHDEGRTARALSEIGYSKRNVAIILENLVLGGILTTTAEGNRLVYRIADRETLSRLLQPLPVSSGRWHLRLPIVVQFLQLSFKLRERDAVVQAVEAEKLFSRLRPAISAAGVVPAVTTASATTYWATLQQWVVDHLISERSDSRRNISRMIEGHWIGPNDHDRHPTRTPDGAILPRLTSGPNDRRVLTCLDLIHAPVVGAPNDWTWAVLSTAAKDVYVHTIGLSRGERWQFAATGTMDIYDVAYDDELAPTRIKKLYGSEAAVRSRTDRPAVQLRLTKQVG